MKKLTLAFLGLWSLPVAFCAGATSLTNHFNSGSDFVTTGIIGNTNWDGVYLGSGDILNGNAGSDGSGQTIQANETASPGRLTLRTTATTWSGAGDDGFLAYKLVAGDFDVSVQTAPPWNPQPITFGGLFVRAWNTNNSGAPASFTGSASENWLALWRFQEFGLDEIRANTNGASFEATFPDSNSDTNSPRYFRITRTGDLFAFYWKTNGPDAWVLITNANPTGGYVPASGTIARPDWHNLSVQVGIAEATFTANSPTQYFADFELSGPNVTFPAMPPAPSALIVTATNTTGSVTLSWNLGNLTDGSLVVMRQLGNIQHNPVNGYTYNSSSNFGNTNACLGGGNQFVVYNGGGGSVTVSNLAGSNVSYSVAVYEYSGSGSSTVYNTANPATILLAGPGTVTNLSLSLNSTNIPVGGAASPRLLATYSSGQSNVVVSIDPSTIWTSSNTNVVTIGPDGTVNGIGIGSASVTGALGGFQAAANVTVHAPAFADTFTLTNDFLNGGLIGSRWDGLYLKFGDVPGGSAGATGAGDTTNLNSQIDSTNGLFLSSAQSDWQGVGDDGPFLFKLAPGSINAVSGDFEAVVHVFSEGLLNFESVGIMARLFNASNGGPGPGGTENHVNYWKVQNSPTSVRRTENGANTTVFAAGPSTTNGWLLLQRVNSTNFYVFEKFAGNDPWTLVTNTVFATASNNAPMQVGIAQQTLSAVTGHAVVDNFMLDAAGITTLLTSPPPASGVTMVLNSNLTITVSYTVGTNADGTAIRSVVVMRAGGPITAQPYTGMALAGNSVFGDPNNDLGGGNFVVYRSPTGSLQTNQSVTVTGLSSATVYYVLVYTYVGSGATRTYNELGSGPGFPISEPPLQGIIVNIPPVPLNGIGLIQVFGNYLGMPLLPLVIGTNNPVITSGNTNVVKVLDGIVSGVGLGTTTVTVVYGTSTGSFTNVFDVTVHQAAFNDDFSTSHDYLLNGVGGTIYDGIYDVSGTHPIPGSIYVPPAGSGTVVADANISSNHFLTITGTGDGWERDVSGGFFLFKYVPGDFQMAVHLNGYTKAAFNMPGLLARAYAASNGILGQPLGYDVPDFNGTNDTGEYWVSIVRFDYIGVGTYTRLNTDAMVQQNTQPDQNDTNNWLLVVRSAGTNFSFYKKMNLSDPWRNLPTKTVYHVPQFAGRPMQVGLMAGDWNFAPALPNSVTFDGFMLDLTSSELSLRISNNGDGSLTVSWPADPTSQLWSTPSLAPPNWQPVGGTPVLGLDGRYRLSVSNLGSGQYFRLRN